MDNNSIIYPLIALVAWTLAMAIVMIRRAFRAVGEGLNPEYFRYGMGFKAPGYMRSAYQHFENLFEMPVLFYLAIVTIHITHISSALLLFFSWAYVVSRVVHSHYHLDNANVRHRRNAFLVSYILLVLLWGVLSVTLIGI